MLKKSFEGFKYPLELEKSPLWDGQKFCKNLLVIGEQGLGDEIFYLSVLKQLQERVQSVTVVMDSRLISIFSRSFPSIIFLERNSAIDSNKYDAQILLGNLFAILNVDPVENFWKRGPYLLDNSSLTKKLRDSLIFKNKFTCGIAWKSANPTLGRHKSITMADIQSQLKVKDIHFINLQYGDISEDVGLIKKVEDVSFNQVPDIDLFNDLDGLLSIINACDVVVTTSNVTAHLSGAIGKKTFLLLPYSKGRIWYWHDEEISTWYPTIKQYFQDSDFNWDSALSEIDLELKKETNQNV